MARITAAEIRDLVARTRSGALCWDVAGRRCQVPGFLLELRSFGGPVLSRVDGRGMATVEVAARIGVLPRGRAIHSLAREVEQQLTDRPIDLVADERVRRPEPKEPAPTPEAETEGCQPPG